MRIYYGKNEKKNAKDVIEDLDQVAGGVVYTPEGAPERAKERRMLQSRMDSDGEFEDVGVWVSYGQGPKAPELVNKGEYIPGRENGNFGNVRG